MHGLDAGPSRSGRCLCSDLIIFINYLNIFVNNFQTFLVVAETNLTIVQINIKLRKNEDEINQYNPFGSNLRASGY